MTARQRREFLAEVAEIVAVDRHTQYGEPEANLAMIADLWGTYLTRRPPTDLTGQDVAAMMALLKIVRIATSPHHRDSWLDLAGYAACGAPPAPPPPPAEVRIPRGSLNLPVPPPTGPNGPPGPAESWHNPNHPKS